jgi:hypothetical protein
MDSIIMKILMKYYIDKEWTCGDTYETLEWYDTTIPKPTEEEFDLKYDELLLDEMREERNKLLKDCDFIVLSDYPNTNKEAWLAYRQELRDFPSVWLPEMPFPEKPE